MDYKKEAFRFRKASYRVNEGGRTPDLQCHKLAL